MTKQEQGAEWDWDSLWGKPCKEPKPISRIECLISIIIGLLILSLLSFIGVSCLLGV